LEVNNRKDKRDYGEGVVGSVNNFVYSLFLMKIQA